MPIDKALSMLRDKHDNIKLDIPIQGPLDEVEIGTGAILNKALAKAATAGMKTYLLQAFQPYGALIAIGSTLADKVGNITLDPVLFDPGLAALNDAHRDYLKKLGAVMTDRPALEVRLCGMVTEADLLAAAGEPAKKWYRPGEADKPVLDREAVPEELWERLRGLGGERAKAIKDHLIQAHGLDAGRQHLCEPEYDGGTGAKPRVELFIS